MVKIPKTYIPKEKEKYMCAKHLAFFKQKLLDWKTDLVKTNNEAIIQASMDDNSASADIVDQASSYTEKNVEMRAINRQINSKDRWSIEKNSRWHIWLLCRNR